MIQTYWRCAWSLLENKIDLYNIFNLANSRPLHILNALADSAYIVKSAPQRDFSVYFNTLWVC